MPTDFVQRLCKPKKDKYCGTAATDFIVSENYNEKERLQLWNKSSKISTFTTLNEDNNDLKKRRKNENTLKITNKSTISLHIAAYENSTEAAGSNLSHNENIEGLKKEKFGLIKKQCFTKCLKIRNPFEFPRQQNGNQRNESEGMQFSASQQLLRSQPSTFSQQNGNSAEHQIPLGSGTARKGLRLTMSQNSSRRGGARRQRAVLDDDDGASSVAGSVPGTQSSSVYNGGFDDPVRDEVIAELFGDERGDLDEDDEAGEDLFGDDMER
uniref:Uncharacterized protein n=1 Tax=Panagrolaimus davidi TaxID=227884 RepID=A0A914PNX1_9BILA